MQAETDHSELRRKAEAAREKKAAFGEDIDLDSYGEGSRDLERVDSLEELDEEDRRTLLNAGVIPSGEGRSGSIVLMDESVVHSSSKAQGVEVMALSEALGRHGWLKEYYWKAVSPEADKYTARTFLEEADGYFIRALPGAKLKAPVQTCLMLKGRQVAQAVHNMNLMLGRPEAEGLDLIAPVP